MMTKEVEGVEFPSLAVVGDGVAVVFPVVLLLLVLFVESGDKSTPRFALRKARKRLTLLKTFTMSARTLRVELFAAVNTAA